MARASSSGVKLVGFFARGISFHSISTRPPFFITGHTLYPLVGLSLFGSDHVLTDDMVTISILYNILLATMSLGKRFIKPVFVTQFPFLADGERADG